MGAPDKKNKSGFVFLPPQIVKYAVRLSNANFINNYLQPVFHFNESRVIVTQTLQKEPLAAHASKFQVSKNNPLSLRYSSLPENVFRGSSCVPARGTRDETPKIVYSGGYRHGPIYITAKTAGYNSLHPLFLFRLYHAENVFYICQSSHPGWNVCG